MWKFSHYHDKNTTNFTSNDLPRPLNAHASNCVHHPCVIGAVEQTDSEFEEEASDEDEAMPDEGLNRIPTQGTKQGAQQKRTQDANVSMFIQ